MTLFLPLCCCDTLHKGTSRISRDFLTKYSSGRNTELFILHTSCKHNHIFLSPVFSLFLQCKHHEDQTTTSFLREAFFAEVFNWEIQRGKAGETRRERQRRGREGGEIMGGEKAGEREGDAERVGIMREGGRGRRVEG